MITGVSEALLTGVIARNSAKEVVGARSVGVVGERVGEAGVGVVINERVGVVGEGVGEGGGSVGRRPFNIL